jgi:serine/threonine-protein kinase
MIGDATRIADLFAEALDLPQEERSAFLESRCAGSPGLRAEIESLLAAHEESERSGRLEQVDARRGAALLDRVEGSSLRRVGPYAILREIGRGGMGVVCLAERTEGGFEQRVAIKLLKRGMDSESILRRFLRERQILAGLDHPNVARLLDGGITDGGQPYFAMELVDGEPLTTYCESRRLGLEERLRLFEEACRAVHYAHTRLVVHRDLKPSNMLVTVDGHLKLLDFGVAKLLQDDEDGLTLTAAGAHPLTPRYAAPEQICGEPVTTATDVYALGVVLYELVAGRAPYAVGSSSREDLARAICAVDPPPPSGHPAVPLPRSLRNDLDAVTLKALRKEPARRYASTEALADDVRRCLAAQPVQARPDSVGYRAAKFVRRHRVGVVAAGAAVLSLLAGLCGVAWQAAVAARERDRAQLEAERAEQVKEFLVGIFKSADPAAAQGDEITARELLDRGTERIAADLSRQPAVQSELLHTIAESFYGLGRYDRALSIAERSLETARAVYGGESLEVARAMYTLAAIHYASSDYAAAEDLHRRALAIRRRLLPADSPQVAESLADLGLVLTRRARLDEAEPLLREALEIRRGRFGLEHAETADSIMLLANLLVARSDFTAAAETHAQALALKRKLYGDLHPDVTTSLGALGSALQGKGDLTGAEAAFREALSIDRRVHGPEHVKVALDLHQLGVLLHVKGELQEAATLYREALALSRRIHGKDHFDTARAMGNLAHVLSEMGHFDEALPLFEQSAAMHTRVTGADNPFLAATFEQHAVALVAAGRPREAIPLLDKALAIYRSRYGEDNARTAIALGRLAAARAELGELDEAEKLARQVLETQRRGRTGPHRNIMNALAGLGDVLTRRGRSEEAEPFLREALAMAGQVLPASHWRRGDIESLLGVCLGRLNRRDEALALLRSGYARLSDTLGDRHPATVLAKQRLGSLPDGTSRTGP